MTRGNYSSICKAERRNSCRFVMTVLQLQQILSEVEMRQTGNQNKKPALLPGQSILLGHSKMAAIKQFARKFRLAFHLQLNQWKNIQHWEAYFPSWTPSKFKTVLHNYRPAVSSEMSKWSRVNAIVSNTGETHACSSKRHWWILMKIKLAKRTKKESHCS